ncbi:MAG: hypothetical protein ACPG5B_05655 [Chitinophagales bacterium]
MTKYKAGDFIWGMIGNKYHPTIILEDYSEDNHHQYCMPVCNLSGTKPNVNLNYVIPLDDFKLPSKYFPRNNQKPKNWLICQERECVNTFKFSNDGVLGNLKEDCNELFELICDRTKNCKISTRLNTFCDCENQSNIEVLTDVDCQCDNLPD